MSIYRLIIAAFIHHWRMNLSVAAGAAVGTAVLSGALMVGDSMRGSLRHLAIDRLGNIDEVLLADHFFRARLADELATQDDSGGEISAAAPAIVFSASVENPSGDRPTRANGVQLIGCDERFWRLGGGRYAGPALRPREIVLNRTLADRLGVKPGDEIIVRLPRPGAIPADSALGQKRDTVQSFRLAVGEIVPAEGLGHFGLRPTQREPLNAYVSLDWLQDRLEQPDMANAIFVELYEGGQGLPSVAGSKVQKMLRPKLADLGLSIENTPLRYVNITSNRMILAPGAEEEIVKALKRGASGEIVVQRALTYLANTIGDRSSGDGRREIPYSTITAIDFADRAPLGPFLSSDGKAIAPLKDDEIALNRWAADDLGAKVGDQIAVTYFEPESTEGQTQEATKTFRLAAIVQLSGAADDRQLTPKVKGMTDETTMADWDPPFPFDARRVRPEDEKYWDQHHAVPKAFVSAAAGRRLWGSRFGDATSLRVGLPEGVTFDDVEKRLSGMTPAAFGLAFQPVRQQVLAAAAGTTPFSVLFLAFSIFIIAAAAMLVLLLFRLGVEQRSREIGILMALGLTRRQVRRILLGEGSFTALCGAVLGVALGVGYAGLMLLGLRTWWLAAVVTPFLRLHVTPLSLVLGFACGLLLAVGAIAVSVRGITRVEPRRLLAGYTAISASQIRSSARRLRGVSLPEILLMLVVLATIMVLLFGGLKEDYQAAAFFGGGVVVLVSLLAAVWLRLRGGSLGPAVAVGRGNLLRMAIRNAARNAGRSGLTIALVASASFLIAALSAFQLDPARQTPALASGDGGFSLAVETDRPIYQNLDSREGRAELGFSAEDEEQFKGVKVFGLRVKSGDDASCLNLYRPRQPRILGVPQKFIERGGFAWAAVPPKCEDPWKLLQLDFGQDPDGVPVVPVILEQNTANYSLNLWGGPGETFEIADSQGNKIRLQVAALLAGSIFQGDLLVDEAALVRLFPEVSGYRFFLLETPLQKAKAGDCPDPPVADGTGYPLGALGPPNSAQAVLQRTLGDYGLTAETTAQRMGRFLAVQNTYLSAFQSLGGLGLLLGTLGLAAVQLRNVLERRGELALLRAAGFRRRRLAGLVLLENSFLLLAGLGCGIAAAMVAILPHLISRDATIPWVSLTVTLALVLAAGMLAGAIACARVLRSPLLAALREGK
jgi:putative ABC transport system permease protein